MNKVKSVLRLAISIALVFTFSCSSDKEEDSSGTFKDDRDGTSYKWVKIGKQIWMAENLSYNATGSKCYGEGGKVFNPETKECDITLSSVEIQANCEKYGRLYDRQTANACYSGNSCSENAHRSYGRKGICPSGWHIPDVYELYELLNATDNGNADKLKATSGWNDDSNGQDTYGFSALPGGFSHNKEIFLGVGEYGNWWSWQIGWAPCFVIKPGSKNFYVDHMTCPGLTSVRCIKD